MGQATFFLSDVHLRGPGPRLDRLLAFLRARRGDARAIYLLGDIFDFTLGYRHLLFSPHFALWRALAELVEGGTRVALFAGNHDPDPGPFPRELGLEIHREGQLERIEGRAVWLSHGDVETARSPLRRLSYGLARLPLLQRAARAVHPSLAWQLASLYADRAHRPGYDAPIPPWLVERFWPERIRAGAEIVIIGHFHRAVWHERDHQSFFVLGDWMAHQTYVRAEAGRFELWRDGGPGAQERLALGDHGPPLEGLRRKDQEDGHAARLSSSP